MTQLQSVTVNVFQSLGKFTSFPRERATFRNFTDSEFKKVDDSTRHYKTASNEHRLEYVNNSLACVGIDCKVLQQLCLTEGSAWFPPYLGKPVDVEDAGILCCYLWSLDVDTRLTPTGNPKLKAFFCLVESLYSCG